MPGQDRRPAVWSKLLIAAGRLLFGLMVIGGFTVLIIFTFAADRLGWGAPDKQEDELQVELPAMPVSTRRVQLESIEITDTYSGMIRPLERFSLGFEMGGRVWKLGTNQKGKPLDDGDLVKSSQVLAVLDIQRVLDARLSEAKAQYEQADSDLNRAKELRGGGASAVSETEYQQRVTALAVAAASRAVAEKAFEDATLTAPVDAVISKRIVNVGESVTPHQTVMELIQVEDVLLVVGVPEAFVGEIQVGQAAHVDLFAKDRFRRKRPSLRGTVHRVAAAADGTTGLFEVEILVQNKEGVLKPGRIGLAHVVVDRRDGFRVPTTAAVFRDGKTLLFSVGDDAKAHSFEVDRWIEQGPDMILNELPPEHQRVVVRGQHRLIDSRSVRDAPE